MARRRISTTVYLDLDQVGALQALSKRTGVPQSAYIREGIRRVLKRAARVEATGRAADIAGLNRR